MADDVLDAIRRAARADATPELDPERAAEMIERALAARHDAPVPRSRAPWRAVLAVAAAVVLIVIGTTTLPLTPAPHVDERATPERSERSRMTLPTGDALVIAESTDYEIESIAPARSVRLRSGALLCDVAPLGEDTSFRVSLPHLDVLVLGTVFGVRATERASFVWVYEGRVRVTRDDGATRVLRAGDSLRSDTFGEAGASDPLAAEGAHARDARLAHEAPAPIRAAAPARADDAEAPAHRPPRIAPRAPDDARSITQPATSDVSDVIEPAEGLDGARPSLDANGAAAIDDARARIARGEAASALARADAALAVRDDAAWRVVRADALRALGRPRDAIVDLERAAELAPDRAAPIGYRIALVRLRALRDPRGALDALSAHGVTSEGSPLAERGLALATEAQRALGDAHALRRAEEEHRSRFPSASP